MASVYMLKLLRRSRQSSNSCHSKPETDFAHLKTEKGVALILILWVLFLLSIIAAEFAFSMRTDFAVTLNFKEETEAYYLAQAGVHQAIAELLHQKMEFAQNSKDRKASSPGEELPDTSSTPLELTKTLVSGTFSYKKTDEQGKININSLKKNRQILMCLLEETAGITDESQQNTIIDSIMDWMDPDDLFLPAGAEEDYYQGLSPPYHCKNGPFSTVEELLLVQGMTREILFGSEGSEENEGKNYPGMGRYLTVWTKRGIVRQDIAVENVLRCQFNEGTAEQEMDRRRDLQENPPDFPQQEREPSPYWSIIAEGHPTGGNNVRTIKTVVAVTRDTKQKVDTVEIRYWDDNYIDRFVPYREDSEEEE